MRLQILRGAAESRGKNHRTRVRLSLRTSMLLVLGLAVGLGWMVARAKVQREARDIILKRGGKAYFDWELTTYYGPYSAYLQVVAAGKPIWPRWMIDAFGPDYFGSIKFVIVGPNDADGAMEQVARLGRLEQLYFSPKGDLTDLGLKRIEGLGRLKSVMLGGTPGVSGAGLAGLANSPALARLIVHDVSVKDDELAFLEELPALTELELTGTRITDAGLASFRNLSRLIRFPKICCTLSRPPG